MARTSRRKVKAINGLVMFSSVSWWMGILFSAKSHIYLNRKTMRKSDVPTNLTLPSPRDWHGKLAVLAIIPIALVTITGTSSYSCRLSPGLRPASRSALISRLPTFRRLGMAYRIARRWLGYSSEQVGWLMDIHTLQFLGLNRVYPLIVGSLFIST